MSGQDITFNVNDQSTAGYLALPEGTNAPGVIVLHAWWGLNPFFKSLCDRLALEGFAAFAPDLREGHVAKTVAEAKQLVDELDEMKNLPVVTSAADFLLAQSKVQKGALSVIGFSMGAAWSLVLSNQRPDIMNKVVLFYGTYVTDFPAIKANVLGHYAEVDEWEPMDNIRAMESCLRANGLNPAFHIYPNTSHWFFENDRPEYNAEAADLAWKRTLEFLRK